MTERVGAAFAGLDILPAASRIERSIRQGLKERISGNVHKKQLNLINTGKVISDTYEMPGWDTYVIGVDDHPVKDLPLTADSWSIQVVTELANRLSEVPGILNHFLDIENHGSFIPSAELMSVASIVEHNLDLGRLRHITEKLSVQSGISLQSPEVLHVLAAHIHDKRGGTKWFYGAGLGMIPLPLIATQTTIEPGRCPSRPNALNTWSKTAEERNLESAITSTYFVWALKQYEEDLKLIESVTGEQKVYNMSDREPKWRGADHSCNLAGSDGSMEFQEFSEIVRFLDNEFYDTRLTAMKVLLSLRIFHGLNRQETAIREEVRKYPTMKRVEVRRELICRMLGESGTYKRWAVSDLISEDYTVRNMGILQFKPDDLNVLCLDNFWDGNDGTVARKIGADIFCRAAGQPHERDSAWTKIVGRYARVLLCGEDVIITEPLGRSITIMRNDRHWAEMMRESAQPLQSDFNTPRNRLMAEILLGAVSGSEQLIIFLQARLEENDVTYSFEEYSERFQPVSGFKSSSLAKYTFSFYAKLKKDRCLSHLSTIGTAPSFESIAKVD